MRDQGRAAEARGKTGGHRDVAAAGEGRVWLEAAHMADGLHKAERNPAQVGERFPGKIAAQFAGLNAHKGKAGFGHELGFRPALVAEVEYLRPIGCLQRLSDGQGRVNVPPGSAA